MIRQQKSRYIRSQVLWSPSGFSSHRQEILIGHTSDQILEIHGPVNCKMLEARVLAHIELSGGFALFSPKDPCQDTCGMDH